MTIPWSHGDRIYLERHGFAVTLADGGEAGLRVLEEFELRPDDRRHLHAAHARLRIRSGYSTSAHQRSRWLRCRDTLLQTWISPAPDFLRMALELGAARCLRKPFTPAALLAVLTNALPTAALASRAPSNRDSDR